MPACCPAPACGCAPPPAAPAWPSISGRVTAPRRLAACRCCGCCTAPTAWRHRSCAVPVEPIGPADGWCDDSHDPRYNRLVALPYAGRHEELWRRDALYDVVGVLGWNIDPVLPGRGSAIFLHVATPDYAPTAGCIALALPDLLACLAAGLAVIEAS